jgi:hypothetical protein
MRRGYTVCQHYRFIDRWGGGGGGGDMTILTKNQYVTYYTINVEKKEKILSTWLFSIHPLSDKYVDQFHT